MRKFHIPLLLIYARLVFGLMIIVFSIIAVSHYKTIAISLLILGLLTDIFDGIIARKLNISTQKIRRLDSTVDQLFFISVAAATYIQCPAFFSEHATKLIFLLAFEAATYIICFIKFRKEIATHTIGAKIWTLLLCATLIEIIANCGSTILFEIFFWVGLLTRVEIIAIIIALKNWTNDVPSFFHAIKLRKNKAIKRHKLFNG